jgi:hypothetical protein
MQLQVLFGKMTKVGIAGNGKVGTELLQILPDNIQVCIYTRKKNNFDEIFNCDIIIDVMDSLDKSKELFLLTDKLNIPLVMCNKEFVWNNLDEISKSKNKIYLHSIVSSNNYKEFPPLDNSNIKNYLDKNLFIYRGGGAKETAYFLLQDLIRFINTKT